MNALSIRSSVLACGALLVAPLALAAHQGHAGDHAWLAGAAEPLLSADHLLAGLFVAALATLAAMGVARALRPRRNEAAIAEP